MSVLPGMPEYKSLADRLKTLEAEVARLSRARKLQSASIGSGGLTIKDGGQLQVLDAAGNVIATFDVDGATIHEADGSVLIELDGTGLQLNDAAGSKLIDLTTAGLRAFDGANLLVQVDDTGVRVFEADGSPLMSLTGSKLRFNRSDGTRSLEITPAGGLKVYEADGATVLTTIDGTGVQVGTDVVIDSQGLKIEGVIQPALDVQTAGAQNTGSGFTITDTHTTFASFTFSTPPWATSAAIIISGTLIAFKPTGADGIVSMVLTIDANAATPSSVSFRADFPNDGNRHTIAGSHSETISSPGSSIVCELTAASGTLEDVDGDTAALSGVAVFTR